MSVEGVAATRVIQCEDTSARSTNMVSAIIAAIALILWMVIRLLGSVFRKDYTAAVCRPRSADADQF